MEEPPLLKIYANTEKIILYKRKLFQNINIEQTNSPLQHTPKTTSTKIYICLQKFISELQTYFSALANHNKFQSHLSDISNITSKLKNNRDFLSQEQEIFTKIEGLIKNWNSTKDPLQYYSIKQRQQLHDKINENINELQKWYMNNQQLKKPLYIRKMQRELRQNLVNFSKQQILYNNYQQSFYDTLKLKITRLLAKLINLILKMPKEELINQEKTQLLKKYIDIFSNNSISNEKQISQYKIDLIRTYKNMVKIFQLQKLNFEHLLQYLSALELTIQSTYRAFRQAQDQFSRQVKGVPDQIFTIVGFEEILPIVNSAKNLFNFHRDLKILKIKISEKSIYLHQTLDNLNDLINKTGTRNLNNKGNVIQQFIMDKKNMEYLVKKERIFEDYLMQNLSEFFQKYESYLRQMSGKNVKNIDSEKQQVSKALDQLFINYFQQTETLQKTQDNSKYKYVSSINIRQKNAKKIKQIQNFLKSLKIFSEVVDLSESYNCSLGPKILINGQLKTLPSGLYFQSNFNKKNVFFGNTKLFIPKEQIFEINKQKYLFLSISTEIITKVGTIFFNSINKQEVIYDQLISFYLPEVGIQQTTQDLQFNTFKGSEEEIYLKIQPYLNHYPNFICQGKIQNISLPLFFHKYYSTQEFSYQGKKYKDFKQYSCELAGGTEIKSTGFTPRIPYYFQLINKQSKETNNIETIQLSQRLFTYNKSIPYIPFLSQGGFGVCSQKNIYRWGGPKIFVIQIINIVSGFSLLEGMNVKIRQIFQEKQNCVCYHMSSDIQFQISKATNSLLRSPTLSETKAFVCQIAEKLDKIEKNRKVINMDKHKSVEKVGNNDQELVKLNEQVKNLKKRIKGMSILFVVVYLVTLCFIFY